MKVIVVPIPNRVVKSSLFTRINTDINQSHINTRSTRYTYQAELILRTCIGLVFYHVFDSPPITLLSGSSEVVSTHRQWLNKCYTCDLEGNFGGEIKVNVYRFSGDSRSRVALVECLLNVSILYV